MSKRYAYVFALGSLIAVFLPGPEGGIAAAAYPERPIRVVVPNPAGSNSDLIMRFLAPRLSDQFKQTIVIDNRPGGNGVIANNVVRAAAPDGYTVLFGTATNLAGSTAGGKMEYDPIDEFSAIGMIATLPYVLVVGNSLPVTSVRELVEYVKARPDKTNFAYTPGGSLYAGGLFAHVAQLKSTAVPFNSGTQAITAIINGDVNFMFYPYQALSAQIKANRMKVIATTAASRPTWLNSVPTMVEAGYPDLDLSTFVGLYVPLKTPKHLIAGFSRVLISSLKDTDLQAKYAEVGTVVAPMSPEATDKFTAAAVKKFRELEKMSVAKRS